MELPAQPPSMKDCIDRIRNRRLNAGHREDNDYWADIRTVLCFVYNSVMYPEFSQMNVTKKEWWLLKRAMLDSLFERNEQFHSQDKSFILAITESFSKRQ